MNEDNEAIGPGAGRVPPILLNIQNTGTMLFHGPTSSMNGIYLLNLILESLLTGLPIHSKKLHMSASRP